MRDRDSGATQTRYPAIAADLVGERFGEVIDGVRRAIGADSRAAFSDPLVKHWLGRRYRNLFLAECVRDQHAREVAKADRHGLLDLRTQQLRTADRFLADFDERELSDEMPVVADFRVTDTTILFAPGLLTGLLPDLALSDTWPVIHARFGVRVLAADSHPMRTCSANTRDLAVALVDGVGHDETSAFHAPGQGSPIEGDVILVGYSKGGPDSLTFLVERPELAGRVRAVVGWAPAFMGSPVAEEALRADDAVVPDLLDRAQRIFHAFTPSLPDVARARLEYRAEEYDIPGALRDLSTSYRTQWLAQHAAALDALGIPVFSIAGDAGIQDVPIYQKSSVATLDQIDEHNDMQVLERDTRIDVPLYTPLALMHGHHWDLAYPAFPEIVGDTLVVNLLGRVLSAGTEHEFARVPAMAALLKLLHEVGLIGGEPLKPGELAAPLVEYTPTPRAATARSAEEVEAAQQALRSEVTGLRAALDDRFAALTPQERAETVARGDALRDRVAQLGRSWWFLLILGVLTGGLALLVWARPWGAGTAIAWAIGLWLMLTGGGQLLRAAASRLDARNRGMLLLSGVSSVVAGLLCVANSEATLKVVVIVVGVSLVVRGGLEALQGVRTGARNDLTTGVGLVVVGFVLLAWPQIPLTAAALLLGALLMLLAVLQVVGALKLRGLNARLRARRTTA